MSANLTNDTIHEMCVIWITNNITKDSIVYYGTNPYNLTMYNIGWSSTYDVGLFFGWKGRIHYALMNNLKPNTKYYYIVGMNNFWSDLNYFITMPDYIGNNLNINKEQNIAIWGDMGTVQLMGWKVANQMIIDTSQNIRKFDLMVHVGDISYAGVSDGWSIQYFWDLFLRQMSPLASNIPYMVSVGNHEKYYNFTSFKHRFIMPGQWKNNFNIDSLFYYSYNYGLIHFISMCTEDYIYDYTPNTSKQYKWLLNDLKSINRTKTPWIILLGHRPMYSTDKSTDSGPLQQYIEPLMLQFNIDLGIWGHMHCYERYVSI